MYVETLPDVNAPKSCTHFFTIGQAQEFVPGEAAYSNGSIAAASGGWLRELRQKPWLRVLRVTPRQQTRQVARGRSHDAFIRQVARAALASDTGHESIQRESSQSNVRISLVFHSSS